MTNGIQPTFCWRMVSTVLVTRGHSYVDVSVNACTLLANQFHPCGCLLCSSPEKADLLEENYWMQLQNRTKTEPLPYSLSPSPSMAEKVLPVDQH